MFGADAESHLAADRARQPLDLGGVEICQLLGRFDLCQGPVTCGGDCTHKVFIEAATEAKGAGSDAPLRQPLHLGCDGACVGEAFIGLAVREQQHAAEFCWIQLLRHLGGTSQPS